MIRVVLSESKDGLRSGMAPATRCWPRALQLRGLSWLRVMAEVCWPFIDNWKIRAKRRKAIERKPLINIIHWRMVIFSMPALKNISNFFDIWLPNLKKSADLKINNNQLTWNSKQSADLKFKTISWFQHLKQQLTWIRHFNNSFFLDTRQLNRLVDRLDLQPDK